MTAQSENQQQNNTGRKRFRSDDATNGPSNQQMPPPRAPQSNQQRPTHTITSETLEDLLCDENIKIERVETDYNRPETGPWHYHDSAKCIVHISLNNATKVEVRLYDLIYGEYRIPPQPRNDATTSTSTTTTTPHPPTAAQDAPSNQQRPISTVAMATSGSGDSNSVCGYTPLPKFNSGRNSCWINSLIHIILVLLKHQTIGVEITNRFEIKFWEHMEEILQKYNYHKTDFYSNRITVTAADQKWSLRRLFSKLVYDNGRVDNDQQNDSIEEFLNFIAKQEKLTNFVFRTKVYNLCKTCNHTRPIHEEANNSFGYRVKEGRPINITDALQEESEGPELFCDTCRRLQAHKQKTEFIQTSEFLLVTFNRSLGNWSRIPGTNQLQIVNHKYVTTPVSYLQNIKINTVQAGPVFYNAIAAINYIFGGYGKGESHGHYTASVKTNGQWYNADDGNIRGDADGPRVPRLLLLQKVQQR